MSVFKPASTMLRPQGEGILITGCSSGIGRAAAIYLAQRGFTVFATVRKQADQDALIALNQPNLVPICPLDLSKPEHIPHVVEAVKQELAKRGKTGLYAILNNAGGGFVAPVEAMDLGKFRAELETRVVGPVALAQALLPLLRLAPGRRILWITTPALIAIPYVSSIHAGEFAMNCVAQALHLELMRWRIPNILIACGGINTAASEKSTRELEAEIQRWNPEQQRLYAPAMQKLQERLGQFDQGRNEPEEVAVLIYQALCARRPKRKYTIGHGAMLMSMLRFLPQPVVDYAFSKLV